MLHNSDVLFFLLNLVSCTKKTPGKKKFKYLLNDSVLFDNPAEFAPKINIEFLDFELRFEFD